MTDVESIKELVIKSGNSFHCRVSSYLEKNGWSILVSPYYMDNASNKPREIDLVAEKHWDCTPTFEPNERQVLSIKLFIECKYIPSKVIFWFANKDIESTQKIFEQYSQIHTNRPGVTGHHYLKSNDQVAKLFEEVNSNNKKLDNTSMYKALNQSLNAMLYLRKRETIVPQQPYPRRNPVIIETLEMPVIVINSFDNFYKVKMSEVGKGEVNPEKIIDNFLMEVDYAYTEGQGFHKSEYFLIDVLDLNKMDNYLQALESDIVSIRTYL